MKVKLLGIIISSLLAFNTATPFNFNVVSNLGEGYNLGVKYNNKVVPLDSSEFPLFKGTIEDNNLSNYKYVAIDNSNKVVKEESITRKYSKDISGINEVFDRTNKSIEIPELPKPLQPIFPLGANKFQPFPNNVIFNVYAKCDEASYYKLVSSPFKKNSDEKNEDTIQCQISIISPQTKFKSPGTLKIVGFGSRHFKKLSWNIKFTDKKFYGRKAIKMRGMACDSSLMREKFATELYKSAGIPVQEGTYARFFINDDIYGLYLIHDSFNKKWIGAYLHGDEDASIGFSYKMDSSAPDGPFADLKYKGSNINKYKDNGIYELDSYDDKKINKTDLNAQWSPLINFTKLYDNWVNTYKDDISDKAIDELSKFLDVESTLRLLAIETLIIPIDNFWLISGNTALYYNTEKNNYNFIPYDFDQVLVGSWGDELLDPSNYIKDCITWANYNKAYTHYFTSNLFKHPQIKKRYDIILATLLRSTFDYENSINFLSAIYNLIEEDAQWNIDAVNNLDIPYNGIVEDFSLEEFQRSLTYKHKGNSIRESYELGEFIDVRGGYCRSYTKNVDITENVYGFIINEVTNNNGGNNNNVNNNNNSEGKGTTEDIVEDFTTDINNEDATAEATTEDIIEITTEDVNNEDVTAEVTTEDIIEITTEGVNNEDVTEDIVEDISEEIYNFNVISILNNNYKLGVKYNDIVIPLSASAFPLFTGNINSKNLEEYKYVVIDNMNKIIQEESITRIYSEQNSSIIEVFNRNNKYFEIPELPKPLEPIYPLGTEEFQPFPNNIIFNVYAKCNETGYSYLTTQPFLKDGRKNDESIQCVINIISPESTFQSTGTIKISGYGSRKYKKLTWTIKFDDDNEFYGRKTIKMKGIANDSSLMREKLATELYKSVGIPVQEGSYARFTINGDIYGLYLLSDNLNKQWISANLHGNENASIGFSYKMDSETPEGPYADLKYLGSKPKYYNGIYELDVYDDKIVDSNDLNAQFAPLIKFTKLYRDWVNKYQDDESDEAVIELEKFLDLESVLRLMAIDTLILPLDNFWLISSNTALYYNKERNNYTFLPYDFDQSLYGSWGIETLDPNNYIQDCITWANYNESIYEHYFINNLLKHPQIKDKYNIILAKIVGSTFDYQVVSNFLFATHNLIQEDVQWNIDAVNTLNIPYNGSIVNFTLDDFEESLTYKHNKNTVREDYELLEFIELRGGYCKAYTDSISKLDIKPENGKQTTYSFNVVSILGEGYIMGVKYNDVIVPLNITLFPLFSGVVQADNITEYNYVAINKNSTVVEEENFLRMYSEENSKINEVFGRTNLIVTHPDLPNTLTPMFSKGSNGFQPIPDHVIYNVYAKCDEIGYTNVVSSPFINEDGNTNNSSFECNINIISPFFTFQSKGTMKLSGYNRFKKLSWSIQFSDNKFLGRKVIKMKSLANDPSLVREKFTTHLYNTVDVPVQEGAYARFFINDDIYGLYLLTDSINEKWIGARVHGDENASIGISYNLISSAPEGPYANLEYLSDDYEDYEDNGTYEIDQYNENVYNPEDRDSIWYPLIKFTKKYDKWINKYKSDKTSTSIDYLKKYLNIESTLRLLALDTLTIPLNNFFIISSNTALYYNPDKGNYQFLPHDMDDVLVGSWDVDFLDPKKYMDDCITWPNYKEDLYNHYFTNNLLSHPLINKRYNEILAEITRSTYDSNNVFNYINSLVSLIKEDVEWNFNTINVLNIPFNGIVNKFTYEDFEYSFTYAHKGSDNINDYQLFDFIITRNKKCKAYTSNIDTFNTFNID
ncbi:hypothetical protein BCR36DRAFT_411535 [Piromyces finnis]|uniref:Coth-domain-containing protein n=1 Tax=Piromyces finnis TaxID=1754191 RepID=A0A1Y1VC87_9FUNG|nr:hypothetical protein BCR36DRAFT_411535 [Piromyces finnis]|eukprot:ORX52082.1 hypothetical protein BCR36DRAFT_411535 [Piromyces finnis]